MAIETYVFDTPEGLRITVELADQFYEDGYRLREWDVILKPVTGENVTDASSSHSSSGVDVQVSTETQLEDDRF